MGYLLIVYGHSSGHLWPFIGASPDGIVNCDCCPKGVLEIKSPYCHRNESIISATVNDKKFCLREEDEILHLDCSHQYYYQVQTQIFVCDVAYCDLCMHFRRGGRRINSHRRCLQK